jgi:hypothetical protein
MMKQFSEEQGSTLGFGGFQANSLLSTVELMQTYFVISQNEAIGNL